MNSLPSPFQSQSRRPPGIASKLNSRHVEIPVFPEFRSLTLIDKPVIDRLLEQFPPQTSEFTFTNLIAWPQSYGLISTLGGHLLIGTWTGSSLKLLAPLGPPNGIKVVIENCFRLKSSEHELEFVRLPGSVVASFAYESGYEIVEDRDNADYIYLSEDLMELNGSRYDGKRNLIKRFAENHSFKYQDLTYSDIPECLSFAFEWYQLRASANSQCLFREFTAMERMLRNMTRLGITGGVIRNSVGRIIAFTLGERLNESTLVIHMEKAKGAAPGLYQTINMRFAQSHAKDFLFINREQDLGIEGLRKAKQSYYPHHLVMKYSLRQTRRSQ